MSEERERAAEESAAEEAASEESVQRSEEADAKQYVTVILLFVAIIGAVAFVFWRAGRGGPRLPVPELQVSRVGQFPYDWEIRNLEGEQREMSEFRDKVVFLNLWAHWCGPCRLEMPNVQALHREFEGDDRIAVLAVFWESPEETRRFIQQEGLTLPVWQALPLPAQVAPRAVPTTYIVAPDGTVVYGHAGAAAWDHPSVAAFLRELAAEGTEAATTERQTVEAADTP